MASNRVKYGKVNQKSARLLGVQEASGLVACGDGAFFVVDDEHGICRCTPDGGMTQLQAGKNLADLEGIAITPDEKSVFVLSEGDGSIWRFVVDDGDLLDGVRLGALPPLSKKVNRGWEGIVFVAAGTFVEQKVLMAVHQRKPRRIGLFDADTLEQSMLLRLPKDARESFGDLNDIAVDSSGRILLLSGKSGQIAEMRLDGEVFSLVRIYPIETSEGDVPEGINIDADGRVWICTDGKGTLRQIELEP